VSERDHGANNLTYLEQRYAALETKIANALLHRPTDDLVVADLKYRKPNTGGISIEAAPRLANALAI
jgi:hypothetical protein